MPRRSRPRKKVIASPAIALGKLPVVEKIIDAGEDMPVMLPPVRRQLSIHRINRPPPMRHLAGIVERPSNIGTLSGGPWPEDFKILVKTAGSVFKLTLKMIVKEIRRAFGLIEKMTGCGQEMPVMSKPQSAEYMNSVHDHIQMDGSWHPDFHKLVAYNNSDGKEYDLGKVLEIIIRLVKGIASAIPAMKKIGVFVIGVAGAAL